MVEIIFKNDNPFIKINNEIIAPAAFRSFRPTPANVSLFERIGVRFYQMLVSGLTNALGIQYSLYGEVWKGHGIYDFSAFDKQMEMFLEFAPNGYFCIMIQLDTRDWWEEEHPDVQSSFRNLGNTIISEDWKNDAAEYLKAFIRYAEEKYGDKIYAYSFSCGYATEWFTKEMQIPDPKKLEAYKVFIENDTVEMPQLSDYLDGTTCFREPKSNELQYLKYSHTLTPDFICYLAKEAQTVINHKKLIGLFYGYVNQDTEKSVHWGTSGYERVWASPDIDIIFSPAAYGKFRNLDGVSSYQICVDSLRLHNKIYLHEIDHRTHLAKYPLENGIFMGDCYETEKETINVLRRELCITLLKNSSYWWFDFIGGYYDSPNYEMELKNHLRIYNELSNKERKQVAEIAVFVNPSSFLYIRNNCKITEDCVRNNLFQLWKCGAPFEIYNQNDLPLIDKNKYKMFIFLNAFETEPNIKDYLKTELSEQYKFFVYAPGYANGDQLDIRYVEELTGINASKFTSDRIELIDYQGIKFGFSTVSNPMFEITDDQAEILGSFENGKCGFAYKNKVFYSSVGNIDFSAFRDAAKKAGIHIYNEYGDGVIVCSQFIASHTMRTEDCELILPYDGEFEELFDGGEYKTENKVLRYKAPLGHTKMFILKKKFMEPIEQSKTK